MSVSAHAFSFFGGFLPTTEQKSRAGGESSRAGGAGEGMRLINGRMFWEDAERIITEQIGYCLPDQWWIDVSADQAEDQVGGWIDVEEIEIDPSAKRAYFWGVYESVNGERYAVEGWWDSDGYWEFDRV